MTFFYDGTCKIGNEVMGGGSARKILAKAQKQALRAQYCRFIQRSDAQRRSPDPP